MRPTINNDCDIYDVYSCTTQIWTAVFHVDVFFCWANLIRLIPEEWCFCVFFFFQFLHVWLPLWPQRGLHWCVRHWHTLSFEMFSFTVICMESSLQIMQWVWRCWRFSRKPQREPSMLIRLLAPQPISLRYVYASVRIVMVRVLIFFHYWPRHL